MKRCAFIAIALFVVAALAVPAMALEAKFSGNMRVRGFYINHMNLSEDIAADANAVPPVAAAPSPSIDWYDMRYRMRTIMKINDMLSIDSQINVYDNRVLGTAVGTNVGKDDVTVERLWIQLNTEYGNFQFGRTPSGWGTEFKRNAGESDRAIIYTLPTIWKNHIIAFQYLFAVESDKVANPQVSDDDYIIPLGYWIWIHPNWLAGVLFTWAHWPTGIVDMDQYGISPTFSGKYGPWNYVFELKYDFGQRDYDENALAYAAQNDADYDALAYWLELGYSFGPFNLTGGYLFNEGDKDGEADGNIDNTGGIGEDWNKLLILNGDDMELNTTFPLGGIGALGSANAASQYGAKIMYATFSYSPLENLKLALTWGTSDADTVPANWSQEHGTEYDFNLYWNIIPNLNYHFAAAYLDAGDFWRGAVPVGQQGRKLENMTGIFHELTVNF